MLGLVLDSSAVIAAERRKQTVAEFIGVLAETWGPVELVLSPVSVAELVHGIYRAQEEAVATRRREFITELVRVVPVYPVTRETGWLVGQLQGQQAAQGNVLPLADLMIAAAAIEQGDAVLTGNTRHFHRIPGLDVVEAV